MGTCQSQPPSQASIDQGFDLIQGHQPAPRARFNPFYQTNSQQSNQQHVLSNFKFHSNYEDKFLGRCNVLEEKDSGNLYLCKDIKFADEEDYQRKLAELKERKQRLNSDNVIQIKEILSKSTEGFFSEGKKIMLIVDYPLINLQKQYGNRVLNRLQFSRQEILNIMYSAIRGYADIQRAGYPNDKVRLKNMFVGIKDKQSLTKVIESSLLAEDSNYNCINAYGFNFSDNKDCYLSPEEFNAYVDAKPNFRSVKSGVFSLGVSLLELCLMGTSRTIYNYGDKKLDYGQVKNRILLAGRKHGPIAERFLTDMLEYEESHRLSFTQLQAKIPKLISNQSNVNQSVMRYSVIKSQNDFIQHNNASLRNSRSNVSNYSISNSRAASPSRVFASRVKVQKENEQELQNIHQEYTNGNQYIGQKFKGLKHGKGKYLFKDKSQYEGNWKNNKMEGHGQLYFDNGKVEYSGQWRGDEYCGWGTLFAKDGSGSAWTKYEGEFMNGQKEGRGKMYFVNDVVYDGQFLGGKIHGRGRKIDNGVVTQKSWELVSPEHFIHP